jgi:transcriptional regulator with AAA-type ATPase domain
VIDAGTITQSVADEPLALGDRQGAARLALVIVWSEAAPERVGEVAILGPPGSVYVFGRGEPPEEEREGAWIAFARHRPGVIAPAARIEAPAISRRQLRVQVQEDALLVTRTGRCPMAVGGRDVDRAVLLPGETLLLKRQMLLLCVPRTDRLPPLRDFPSAACGAFGAPDALGILGESPAAWQLREETAFLAKADGNILVSGPSGAGKELVARAAHALSRRASGPFVARNAATLPPGLVDAELFGHARNYPNPGSPERPGLIGQADGGTLFLDEIGEASHEVQAHLLRVLDAGEYHRLGEATARRADVRLIAATNRAATELKHDLAARLPLRVRVPDLDERREDIPLLSFHLLRHARQANPDIGARFFAGDHPRLDPALVDHLVRRPYTTHVRELDAILWRAMTASPSDVVMLPAEPDPAPPPPKAPRRAPPAEPTVDEIRAAARHHGGNLAQAARALGLANRYALYRLLKRHGIDPDALR